MTSNHSTNVRRLMGIAIAISAATATLSCNSSPDSLVLQPSASTQTGSAPTSQAVGGHWIADGRLRQVMAELNKQNPTWPNGLPQEPESPAAASAPHQFDEIAVLANSLAAAADQLPTVGSHIAMGEADRAGFLAEARTLHQQAVELQAAANRRSIEQMQRQMDGINSTCISCHSRYRDFSGQINRTQASIDRADLLATVAPLGTAASQP